MKRMLSDYPELIAEWDYKNNDRNPSDISYGSTYKAKWICSKCGNHFEMEVRARTKGRNCQKCKRSRQTSFMEQAILYYIKKCFGNVEHRYKKLFKNNMEIDIYLPNLFTGIEFDGAFFHQRPEQRERDAFKYKLCKQNGITLIRITEDKRMPFDYESDYLISLKGKRDSNTKNEAICTLLFMLSNRDSDFNIDKHLEVVNRINAVCSLLDVERDRKEILASYLSDEKEKSLETKCPELIEEWDYESNYPLLPSMVTPGSNEVVSWVCKKCGKKWDARIYERAGKHRTSCPQCSLRESAKNRKKKLILTKGSLAETHSFLLEKWNYEKNIIKPTEVSAGSHDPVYWKCNVCGYDDWIDTPHHMSVRNSKCPCCLNRVLVKGTNDLKTKRPDLVLDWDYEENHLKPDEVVAGGATIVHWKCHICGNKWTTKLCERTTNGNGCQQCAFSRQSLRQQKAIIQYSKSGLFIKEWKSISEASSALHIGMPGLSIALKDFNKSAGGYRWKYK